MAVVVAVAVAVVGMVLRELPSTEGYWLVGKGPGVAVGRELVENGELGGDKEVGQVADTVEDMAAGMDQQDVVDKGWGDKLGFAGNDPHAS